MSYNRRILDPYSPCAILAAALLLISGGISGAFLAWNLEHLRFSDVLVGYLLPILCCVVMAFQLLFRRGNLMRTILPAVAGTVLLAFRASALPPPAAFLLIAVYFLLAVIYILTVTGILGTRNWLLLLCALPFAIHIFVEDIIFADAASFPGFLPELAVLMILAALFFETWGMRRGRLYS